MSQKAVDAAALEATAESLFKACREYRRAVTAVAPESDLDHLAAGVRSLVPAFTAAVGTLPAAPKAKKGGG